MLCHHFKCCFVFICRPLNGSHHPPVQRSQVPTSRDPWTLSFSGHKSNDERSSHDRTPADSPPSTTPRSQKCWAKGGRKNSTTKTGSLSSWKPSDSGYCTWRSTRITSTGPDLENRTLKIRRRHRQPQRQSSQSRHPNPSKFTQPKRRKTLRRCDSRSFSLGRLSSRSEHFQRRASTTTGSTSVSSSTQSSRQASRPTASTNSQQYQSFPRRPILESPSTNSNLKTWRTISERFPQVPAVVQIQALPQTQRKSHPLVNSHNSSSNCWHSGPNGTETF